MARKLVALCMSLALAGCGDGAPKPLIKIMTGGISFDPSHTHATVTLVVRQLSPLPKNGSLTAELSLPNAAENRALGLPVTQGQLLYRFTMDFAADSKTSNNFQARVIAHDASGKAISSVTGDFGASIGKHEMPRNSDMVPDRERQVEQLNDEGF